MQSVIRIGSRESRLAVIQAEIIRDMILKNHPELQIEIVTMKTTGDKIQNQSLEKIGGKGLFVKELDKALMEGRIDISVHSLKDMPMEMPGELPVLAYAKREDPRDVLIYKPGENRMPECGVIGTSSRRRKVQLGNIYQDCTFQMIRGNVQTRLRKLSEEGYDATVLAAAGLVRLGMEHVIGRYFDTEEVIPAAGQGILAVQGRKGEDYSYLEGINHPETEAAALAERQFVTVLGGGCTSPAAAYARVNGEELKLTGLYYRESDGRYFTESICTGERERAKEAGEMLADRMRKKYGE